MTPPTTPNHVLRAWREDHSMTRLQMADAINGTPTAENCNLHCSPRLIAAWETGRIRWPHRYYQAALRDLTGHTATELGFTDPTQHHHPPPHPHAHPTAGPSTPGDIRQTTTAVLTHAPELDITDGDGELIITNPFQIDRGYVAVSLDDGYVSWCPGCCSPHPGCTGRRDYYGHLEGITTDHDDDHTPEGARPVPTLMIAHLLTADTG